jgi:alkanesulfonate monooxygenase SsuD/methylene tetrahydromethanopterin reductase-like flavin-dependent oxidoreductase (luciferase family)
VITTHTDFHDIERAGILPRPAGPIPIWFGGAAERQLRRAARVGDGFICTRADERARGLVGQLRAFLAEEGRDADPFDLSGMIDWAHGPEECARATAAWREAGGTHLALRVADVLASRLGVPKLGYTTLDRQLEALRDYRELVGVGSAPGSTSTPTS